MFSKKNLNPVPAGPGPAQGSKGLEMLRSALANPYIGASSAALLLLATVAALIALTADPNAGAPVVRISLAKVAGTHAPAGWREALSPETGGAPEVSEDVFSLLEGAAAAPTGAGHAVITLPGQSAAAGTSPLPQAPIAGLTEPGPGGLLPIIAEDGRTPFQAYSRPFTSNGRPKVALVVGGLGLNAKATRQAIETLPPEITLSFVPYAEGLQGWIDLARASGHEVLLETPMEPTDYPENDPGPYTLMAAGTPNDTTKRLEWVMSRATGYFGLTNYLGSRFLASDSAVNAFTASLKSRGLAFIDDGQAARRGGGLPRASADRIIDAEPSQAAIDEQLLAIEALALQKGQALGSGFAYPVTLTQVAQWAQSVQDRGYQLAPASALTTRR